MSITDIKTQFSVDLAKKILSNRLYASLFLEKLGVELSKKAKTSELWDAVVRNWDYNTALPIVRDIFRTTDKFSRGSEASEAVGILREEWDRLSLGNFEWPFSQGQFDGFVQRINSEVISGECKDEKVKAAAVKFRRIKEINTYRNDYIETLIFNSSEVILPTLGHRRGVDFFINGVSFDQKVSNSVTGEFMKKYGDNYRQRAIENPQEVAEYLYMYQDEGRFDANPRLLVAYLDEDIDSQRIEEIIGATDFSHPMQISFTYKHERVGTKTYSVQAILILLHN